MQLNLAEDFMLIDGLETVTLKVSGQSDAILSSCVLVTPYTLRELEPTGAQVLRHGTLFVWPRSQSDAPPLGSVVVDGDGTYWTVWKLISKRGVQTWEPFCLNLSIVTAASNTITVLKGTFGKGRANEAVATWRGLWSGVVGGNAEDAVDARVQPSAETARLEFGAESSLEVYRIYFESPVPIDLAGGEYRLVDSSGNRFRVVRYYNEGRIDHLPVAIAHRITEGSEFWGPVT